MSVAERASETKSSAKVGMSVAERASETKSSANEIPCNLYPSWNGKFSSF